jgi:glycosyltransferase involved in cell wall biosynthesis
VRYLYITADAIGTETGGGSVTAHESAALESFGEAGEAKAWSFPDAPRPWGADDEAANRLLANPAIRPVLAHLYSGTFNNTVTILKDRGCKVVYTAAAHDINVSREEHEKLGIPFDYPHLTDPVQWRKYVGGYLQADVVVCPSTLSKKCMESYGCKNVVIIPHGVDLPQKVKPLPKRFSPAYVGQPGADKGLIYLIQAWALLAYKDATLTIAGRGTEQLLGLVRALGGNSSIYLRGAVDDVSEVYNQCSLYVQASASEGFGMSVLEAMAHGRPVVCSDGAGAADIAKHVVPARNPQLLAEAIHYYRCRPDRAEAVGVQARVVAENYTWEIVHEMYKALWRSL